MNEFLYRHIILFPQTPPPTCLWKLLIGAVSQIFYSLMYLTHGCLTNYTKARI